LGRSAGRRQNQALGLSPRLVALAKTRTYLLPHSIAQASKMSSIVGYVGRRGAVPVTLDRHEAPGGSRLRLALRRCCDVYQSRNLSKSVTGRVIDKTDREHTALTPMHKHTRSAGQETGNIAVYAGYGGFRVLTIGGGTGLANLLKGLKYYVRAADDGISALEARITELSAVVTVTDDGGSSGRLRKEFNMLPPGDIRNCIAALSEDEALLSQLFQHRFQAGSNLNGHSFGNLFLTALTAITGDFAEAVKRSSEILNTHGHVYPATISDVQLEAVMVDGRRVRGETNITASIGRVLEINLVPSDVRPLPQTIEAIANADLITVRPGSLFTSLVPNLLVRGIPAALAASCAIKMFVLQPHDRVQRDSGTHSRRPHPRPQQSRRHPHFQLRSGERNAGLARTQVEVCRAGW
jgi:uncharacterized cofD-like protein